MRRCFGRNLGFPKWELIGLLIGRADRVGPDLIVASCPPRRARTFLARAPSRARSFSPWAASTVHTRMIAEFGGTYVKLAQLLLLYNRYLAGIRTGLGGGNKAFEQGWRSNRAFESRSDASSSNIPIPQTCHRATMTSTIGAQRVKRFSESFGLPSGDSDRHHTVGGAVRCTRFETPNGHEAPGVVRGR